MERRNKQDTALFRQIRKELDTFDIEDCVTIFNNNVEKEQRGSKLTKEEIYTQLIITKILDDYHYWNGDMDAIYGFKSEGV